MRKMTHTVANAESSAKSASTNCPREVEAVSDLLDTPVHVHGGHILAKGFTFWGALPPVC